MGGGGGGGGGEWLISVYGEKTTPVSVCRYKFDLITHFKNSICETYGILPANISPPMK